MPTQVFGPYTATLWTGGVTALNATNMNHIETGPSVAINSVDGDVALGSFVLSGITCARNGVTLNQLDVASGIAYLRMSDNTLAKIATVASTTGQFVTSTPSTTYYLFLKSDGAWQWSTSSSGGGALAIAQATTDGSGNINVVTDVRNTASASGPGVVLAPGRQPGQLVTATTTQTVLTYAPPVTGLYRASGYFWYGNGTPQKPVFKVFWTDPTASAGASASFMAISSGCAGQILNGSQANTPGSNQAVATQPILFNAKSGVNIVTQFTDGGGTPNDTVCVLIERVG